MSVFIRNALCGRSPFFLCRLQPLKTSLLGDVKPSLCCLSKKQYSLDHHNHIKEGDVLSGYTVTKVTPLPDFTGLGISLIHNKTEAEHFHLARDDQNNVFSVGFRTTPLDSTGVPHILEHTTLCGSKRYPCRDPFFKMLNRSLSTFMNAFTASDFTMYPFSTQNAKDYDNLLSVYLDACFFPNLRQMDFWQEGWRLEHEIVDDKSSPIIFKGIVFNEMKGALSSGESIFVTKNQNLLLPSHTYGNVSGGDPLVIPQLTWQQLVDFHQSHYHPTNAKFFTYGDLPLESHLKLIDDVVLRHFEKGTLSTEIPNEQTWSIPRSASITCPIDEMAADQDKQTTVAVSYVLGDVRDPFEAFTLEILSSLLVSGPNSPFYKSLIDSNIGSGYSPVIGLDRYTKDASFSVGLQGVNKDDVEIVLSKIEETFKEAVKNGFEKERVDSILHTVELAQKHQTSNFGLGFISGAMSGWNHGDDPSEMLQINKLVIQFNDSIATNERFLQEKVEQYFLGNKHKLTLTMNPDVDYQKEKEEREVELLKEKLSKLNDSDQKEIFDNGLKLAEMQNEPQDASCLPQMHVKDVDAKIKRTETSSILLSRGVPLQLSEQPTNGISYFRTVCRTSSLSYVTQPYLPFFCHVLTKMGAGGMSYQQLSQQSQLYTGGLSAGVHLSPHFEKEDSFELGVGFSSYCLDKNIPHMFYLWEEIFNGPLFNNKDRLKTLLTAYSADLASSIAGSGHAYAMTTASSSITAQGTIGELMSGITQVRFMKALVENDAIDETIQKLYEIAAHVLSSTEMRCSLNTLPGTMEPGSEALEQFLTMIPSTSADDKDLVERPLFNPKPKKTHIQLPLPVNYVGRSARAVSYNHEDHARLQILAKVMSSKFLHTEIREKGGAYGGGASVGSGTVQFYSYRDPNSMKTLEAFDGAITWAANGKFADQDIEEAKLSVFASVDSPVPPGRRGSSLFYHGITDDMRQLYRDRLFAVSRQDLVDMATKYLLNDDNINSFSIIGPDNEDTTSNDDWVKQKETIN